MPRLGSLTPLRELAALLVPPTCVACELPMPVRLGALCGPCRARLGWLGLDACPRCALPAHGPRGCPAERAPWSRAWAPVAFAGPARSLVHALKFHGAVAVADELAAALAAGPPELLAGAALVPVPADPGRRAARGVDHTALLARRLARRTGRPVAGCLRRGAAPEQVGRGRAARQRAVRGTVAVRGRPPRVAVLVDDVHTTGATLAECARALRGAGSADVRACTYARTT